MVTSEGPRAQPRTDVERVLVVTAHPDDVDFGAAGTVAGWTGVGIEVCYCVCTSGETGGFDDTPREQMTALRQQEQRAAAAAAGVSHVTFLGYSDGSLEPSLELRRDISREIRRVRPDRVIAHSPEIDWDRIVVSHPDHRAAGSATLAAVYPDARNPFAHRELLADEGLEAWAVPEVWFLGAPTRLLNHAVDVTDTFDSKLEALQEHRSQTAGFDDLRGTLEPEFARMARLFDLPEGRLAETFHVVTTA